MNFPRTVLLAIAAALVVSACSSTTTGKPDSGILAPEFDPGFGHVHGVELNPADEMIYAATHHGVFRLGPAGPERIADRYQDTMGFTIAAPDLFLASGHPDPREAGPAHLGLIRSTDRAQTWTDVALRGQADFHALSAAGATVYGFDTVRGVVMRSDDHGQSWQPGAGISVADLDVDPGDPSRVLATTAAGLVRSIDGGKTFSAESPQPPQRLVLIDHISAGSLDDLTSRVVGVDAGGGLWTHAGHGWDSSGRLPGPPEAFTAVNANVHLAATETGVFRSDDAGRTWSAVASTTR